MSIQKINIGGADVEIEDASARNLINTLDDRVTTLENSPGGGGSEWVELTTIDGQVAEITQKFSEIRMFCGTNTGINFSFTCNFVNSLFHNTIGGQPQYFISGSPNTTGNYGVTFKYSVTSEGKQYVSVDTCYDGTGRTNRYTFKAWIKPITNTQ